MSRTVKRHSHKTRRRVIDLASAGKTYDEAARITGVPRSTVATWCSGVFPPARRAAMSSLGATRRNGKAEQIARAIEAARRVGIARAARTYGVSTMSIYRNLSPAENRALPDGGSADVMWERDRAVLTARLRRCIALRFDHYAETGRPLSWKKVGLAVGLSDFGAFDFVRRNAHRLGYEWEAIRRPMPAEAPQARAA